MPSAVLVHNVSHSDLLVSLQCTENEWKELQECKLKQPQVNNNNNNTNNFNTNNNTSSINNAGGINHAKKESLGSSYSMHFIDTAHYNNNTNNADINNIDSININSSNGNSNTGDMRYTSTETGLYNVNSNNNSNGDYEFLSETPGVKCGLIGRPQYGRFSHTTYVFYIYVYGIYKNQN